ncbi:MAG TPA: ComEC/Rec2 family competence protein [Candidatus Dormibacteraeota bacterium]|nr:ComEC/Rec2 family competence protein [Candidatus Dormibacteraeota bacterium]
MKRPLLWVCSLYACGILAGELIGRWPVPLLAFTGALTILALLLKKLRVYFLYALVLLAAWTHYSFSTAFIPEHDLRTILSGQPELVRIRGKLADSPAVRGSENDGRLSWHTLSQLDASALRPDRGDWHPAAGRIVTTTPGTLTNLFGGQEVEVTGVTKFPSVAVGPGLFDYRLYLKRQGIYYHLTASSEQDWQIISSGRRPVADRFREWGRAALARGLPEEDESLRLEWALTLGWKTALTEQVSEPFVRAATYHIFAVDGLRMALVFGIFFVLLRACQVPRPICGAILLPVIWFYVALTGWPASAIRASVMLSIVIIGWILRRPGDLINSLFAAGLIILVWQPQQLFQAGFQLSFCVVLCIILLMPILKAERHWFLDPDPLLPKRLHHRWPAALRIPWHFMRDTFLVSLAAWLGSIPLVAYYFNIISAVSTPANLLAVPLCILVLICNLASLLLSAVWAPLAEPFNHAGWFWMECIRITSQWFTRWPKAYWYLEAPGLFTSLLYYALFLALVTGWLFRKEWRFVKWGITAVVLLCWTSYEVVQSRATQLDILPLGGGNAAFYDSPGTKNDLLVDCGANSTVAFMTKPFLRAHGENTLANFLLTHGDVHQIGGASLIAHEFAPAHIWASPVHARSPAYRQQMDQFGREPEKLHLVSAGDFISSWKVLHPAADNQFPRADDNAVVLAADIRGTKVLLLSSLGKLGQNALLERTNNLRADIVVSGIPTGAEPLSSQLLDRIKPSIIIVTDSETPAWKRANPLLCGRLERTKIPVIYTRSASAVQIKFLNHGWELRTMSGLVFRSQTLKTQN